MSSVCSRNKRNSLVIPILSEWTVWVRGMSEGGKSREGESQTYRQKLGRIKFGSKGTENCFRWILLCFDLLWPFAPVVFSLYCSKSHTVHSLQTVDIHVWFSDMGLSSALGSLLFFLRLCGICTGFVLGELNHSFYELHRTILIIWGV